MKITKQQLVPYRRIYVLMLKIMFCFKSHLNCLRLSVRRKSVWTSRKVARSPYRDVEIPNLTVDQYMFENLDKWANKTATICAATNRKYTYEEVYKKSRTLAANLRKKFKVKDGDVIAVILANNPEFPIAAFGILAAGCVVSPMNPSYTAYEIQRMILLSEVSLIIADEDVVSVLKNATEMAKKKIPIISVNVTQPVPDGTISFKELVEDDHIDVSVLNDVKRHCDDVAFLPYSSGTTGLPKGVQLTHKNMISNCEQQNTELRQYAYTTANHQDNVLVFLPMFHSYGLGIQMLHKMSVGLRLVTLSKFQPQTFVDALLLHRIHLLYVAPPTVLFLGSYPQVAAKHLEHLTCVTSGGAPLPSADIHRLFNKAGVGRYCCKRDIQFAQAYGLTETSPLLSLTPLGHKTFEDVGYALPNIEMRIVDEKLKNLGPNQKGELLVRGPNIMKGYLKNPQANKEVFDGEWLRTGDIGNIDPTGLITITDRLKELIKVKGYQVPPAELENVLKEHPAVLDAAVVGVPDDVTGERPRGFVVLKQGVHANQQDIIEFVSKRVAPYKKIKQILFLDNIPKTPSGKILRKEIKKEYC